MHTVAGDIGALEPPGQLLCEEHVAQLAVAVGLEELPAEAASAQVLVQRQRLQNQTNTTKKGQRVSIGRCDKGTGDR